MMRREFDEASALHKAAQEQLAAKLEQLEEKRDIAVAGTKF